ncbi:MAG: L,D-transpeptidase family protein [Pacificimonas sp.]
MPDIHVDTAAKTLIFADFQVSCLIGRGGGVPAADKREGDGATPLGTYDLNTLLVRPDRRSVPETVLPWRWLAEDDGWSDAVDDPAYNRPVRHPHLHSAERLWRDDGLYDLIVTVSHNTPPVPGLGSAIFLHCTADKPHTEGCVAMAKADLLTLLAGLASDTKLLIA